VAKDGLVDLLCDSRIHQIYGTLVPQVPIVDDAEVV